MRLLPLLVLVPLAACSAKGDASESGMKGTGTGTMRTYAATGFTGVALRGSDDVDVRVGPAFSVRAEGPSAGLDALEIVRDGDILKVGRKREGLGWNGWTGKGLKVHVTMPRIASAAVAGSGNLAIDRVAGAAFDASAAGSGDLSVATLAVGQAKLSLAGSGNMRISGTVDRLTVSIAGSGDVAAPGLRAKSAKVSVAGSGGVRADVDGPANISMVGSGDVNLGARAKCTTSKIGSGEVHCG